MRLCAPAARALMPPKTARCPSPSVPTAFGTTTRELFDTNQWSTVATALTKLHVPISNEFAGLWRPSSTLANLRQLGWRKMNPLLLLRGPRTSPKRRRTPTTTKISMLSMIHSIEESPHASSLVFTNTFFPILLHSSLVDYNYESEFANPNNCSVRKFVNKGFNN